jgi:hypothetical protein
LFAKALRSNGWVYLFIKSCCLTADVALLFVSRSLPGNWSTRYVIYTFVVILENA